MATKMLMERTEVSADKSIAQLQSLLREAGASGVLLQFDQERRPCWALLADLYLARGDARGVARCVARVDSAGGQP